MFISSQLKTAWPSRQPSQWPDVQQKLIVSRLRGPAIETGQDGVSIGEPLGMGGMIDADGRTDRIPELGPVRPAGDHGLDIVGVARDRIGIELLCSEGRIQQFLPVFDPQGISAVVLAVEAEIQAIAVVSDPFHRLFDLIDAVFRDREEEERARIVAVVLEGFGEQAGEPLAAGPDGAQLVIQTRAAEERDQQGYLLESSLWKFFQAIGCEGDISEVFDECVDTAREQGWLAAKDENGIDATIALVLQENVQ